MRRSAGLIRCDPFLAAVGDARDARGRYVPGVPGIIGSRGRGSASGARSPREMPASAPSEYLMLRVCLCARCRSFLHSTSNEGAQGPSVY